MNNLPAVIEAEIFTAEQRFELLELVASADTAPIVPTITETKHYITAGETLKHVKGLFKRIETFRKTVLAPIDAQRDAVQAWFKPYLTKCTEAEAGIKRAMIAYDAEQERQRQEQERKLREQAEKIAAAERAELLAKQAEAMAEGDFSEVEKLQTERDEVKPLVMVVPQVLTPVTGVCTRSTWKARVVDFTALPDKYKLANERAIAQFAQLSKGATAVPGLEFYEEKQIAARI